VSARYPELRPFNRALSHHRAILDGEVVAFGPDGTPSFSALQGRMHLTSDSAAARLAKAAPSPTSSSTCFWLDGHDLTRCPTPSGARACASSSRRAALDGPRPRRRPRLPRARAAMAQGSKGHRQEARLPLHARGAARTPGARSSSCQRQELVVLRLAAGTGRRRDRIGALVVGVNAEDGLRYAGRVGTGFTQPSSTGSRDPRAAERDGSPFTAVGGPKPPLGKAIWVEPRYLAEVEFTEWTPDGQLRHPSYKGLRDDKPAWEVVREDAKAAEVVVDGVPVRLSKPAQGPLPRGRLHEDRRAGLLPADRRRPAAASLRSAAHAQALPQRGRRQVLL
jgi:bifunctional non-homologous end joining protein LigD